MGEYGEIRIRLKEVLEKKGISKTKLCHKAELQYTQLNHYYRNEVTRLDTDVLSRICSALDCQIGDLLEFVPAKK